MMSLRSNLLIQQVDPEKFIGGAAIRSSSGDVELNVTLHLQLITRFRFFHPLLESSD